MLVLVGFLNLPLYPTSSAFYNTSSHYTTQSYQQGDNPFFKKINIIKTQGPLSEIMKVGLVFLSFF